MASLKFMVRKTPLLISTTIKHYVKGPPQPSWDLKIHITNEFLKSTLLDCVNQTVEEIQELSSLPNPAPADITINESKVDNKYRYEAQTYLENILKPYEHVLDTEWKDLKEDGIVAEWVQVSNDGWEERKSKKTVLYLHGGAYYLCSKDSHRYMTTVLARRANARVFVINYRLAPQNQFPAGLQDALAAYLYLLNPPENAGFKSLNPKDIVIAGDSAGGGLSMALSLAIRDAGLPQCAGIICMSPWIDLTSSMPSMLNDKCNDYIPNLTLGLQHIDSPAITDYKKKAAALTAKIKKQNIEPKIWHDSFGNHKERLNMYAPNEGLAIPYVSPLLAESLCNLPPLLLIAGDEERLRDEVIYLAYRATEPTKYKGPSYLGKFEESPFQTPTNITLEIYEEMPHVFQMSESHASAILSMERMIGFIIRVIETPTNELPPSSFYRISSEGKLTPLDGHYKEVLEWEKVGISPSIRANVEDSRKLKMEFVTFMVLFATVISYFML